jgi:hypothetical protein
MKTTRKIGVVTALLVSLSFAARAQTPAQSTSSSSDKQEFRLSVGPEAGLPIGSYSNAYNWILGGRVQAELPVLHNLYVVASAGYDDAFVKNNQKNSQFPARNMQLIPLQAGLRYYIVKNLIYVQGQAGATILGNKTDLLADKSAGFTYSPQVGVLLKLARKNYLDLGFRFEQTTSYYNAGSGNISTLGLRVAYSFGL